MWNGSRHLGGRILARAGGMALAAVLFVPAAFSLLAAPPPWWERTSGAAERIGFGAAEHRYRIAGRIRLALFWVGRDDVGSARMSWQADGTTSALTLLIGSDPQRAPRRLNQWGYLREEQRPESAELFSLRSVDDDGSDASAGFAIGDGPHFAVSCASVEDGEVSSRQAKVAGHGLTYRMFEQLLDRFPAASRWEHRQMPRPAGADAGFLTAIQHAIRLADMPAADGSVKRFQPVAYVYNGYDLDANQPIFNVRTMEAFYRMRAISIVNVLVTIVGSMGLMGLGLAIVGLSGLVACSASRRTRPSDDNGLDYAALLIVAAVVIAVTFVAAYVPARRASRIQPMQALRYE